MNLLWPQSTDSWFANISRLTKTPRKNYAKCPLSYGLMKILIFVSGGGTILSTNSEPVEFKAGDCILIPPAYVGTLKFADDTEYLTVTL